jgi:hypothetical protein
MLHQTAKITSLVPSAWNMDNSRSVVTDLGKLCVDSLYYRQLAWSRPKM